MNEKDNSEEKKESKPEDTIIFIQPDNVTMVIDLEFKVNTEEQ